MTFTRRDGSFAWCVGRLSYRRDRRGSIRGYHGVWMWRGSGDASFGSTRTQRQTTIGPLRIVLRRYASNGLMWFDVYFRHRTVV